MNQSFIQKLTAAAAQNNSLLCVGLDPAPAKFPGHFPPVVDEAALTAWGTAIIRHTADLVCCYKPNIAFYEQFGAAGLEALRQTIAAVPSHIPVLLDAKRGDIGSTAAAYARAAFEWLGADAITLSPYLGQDSLAPFLAYPGKTAFVLAYTSNPSAAAMQEFGPAGVPLFEHVIRQAQGWGTESQIAFVVGATQPRALARARGLLGPARHWILAPGIGAQGGNLADALAAGLLPTGDGLIVPVSRAVIYADDPRAAAMELRNAINAARGQAVPPPPPDAAADLIDGLYRAGCVQFGQFTLASGRQSPIYLDLRRVMSNPALLRQVAAAYADLLAPLTYDRLAAVPYAALPLAAAAALQVNRPLIYPRKEAKDHGTGRMIEGEFAPGEQAALIEDLVTSGGSVLQAAQTLTGAGLAVADVVALIDRRQGGAENLAAVGLRLHAALTLPQIITGLTTLGHLLPEQAVQVEQYLNES